MKNLKSIFILLFIIVAQMAYSQNNKTHREGFKLQLAVDSSTFYEQFVDQSPYFVKENILQIYPGEKLFIEVELKGKEIISMKSVKENENPEKTIEINFSQKTDGRVPKMMMLMVANPFDKKLTYEASMYIVGADKWIKTSIVPIVPNISGYEIWTDVIISLVLSEWKLD